MKISFEHNSEVLEAEIIPNFQQAEDCILVMFLDNTISDNIIFYKESEIWSSPSELQEKYPFTYLSIQKAIQQSFEIEMLFNQVYIQKYLS